MQTKADRKQKDEDNIQAQLEQDNKQVKDMTKKELLREWRDIEFHIRNLGCGRSEIYYRAELESEMHARGIMW